MAMTALPYITKGIGIFYSSLYGLFTLLKEAGVGAGKILKGIFTLDFDSITEGYNQLKNSVSTALDAGVKSFERFEEGSKKMTKTEKENQKERQEAADAAAKKAAEAAQKAKEAAQKAFDEKLKRMEAEDKLDEARLSKLKAEALAIATTEQEKLDVEKRFAELSYNALLKDIEDKQKLYNKNSLDYQNLQTEKINAEAAYTESLTGFKEKQAAIDKDAADKELERQKKLAEEKRTILAIGLEAQIADLDRKNTLLQFDFQQDLDRLNEKRALLDAAEANELANTELNEAQKTEIRQKYADKRKEITNQEIATEIAANDAKTQVALAYLDALAGFGQIMQQLANGNKKVAIAGLLIEKAAALASIAVNAQKNFIKDGGIKSPLAWANLAVAGVSAATVILQAVKGVNDINSAGSGSNATSGGGAPPAQNLGQNYEKGGLIGGRRHAQGGTMIEAEAGEAIMTRGAVTMFAPMLSMMNQMGGGTSFNKNAMVTLPDNPLVTNPAQEQNPLIMKTYVVENELTSMQQRQARLKDLSTL
jgi:hypothetical protein